MWSREQQIHAFGDVLDEPSVSTRARLPQEPLSHTSQNPLNSSNGSSNRSLIMGSRPAVRLSTEYAKHFSGDSVATVLEATLTLDDIDSHAQ